MKRLLRLFGIVLFLVASATIAPNVYAIDGGPLQIEAENGWLAFEVISSGEAAGDGSYQMPDTFDGIGAQLLNDGTLRVQVNHERGVGGPLANISEVNLDLFNLQVAIVLMVISGGTGGVTFVDSARQAYDRWSADGGATWADTHNWNTTKFKWFCSGQSYLADTFGPDRGFVDGIYINGEEEGLPFGRLFALDLANRDFYQVSGNAGSAPGGIGGMPFDSLENAALIDTGETDHVALLMSPDFGSETMRMYIGEKGKAPDGTASNSFLARNGLAYGSWYYLNDSLPVSVGEKSKGFFDTTLEGALTSSKMEDVDTSPSDPTKVVLGDQNSGVFIFDFKLVFTRGSFNTRISNFSITKIRDDEDGIGNLGDPDNVDWTDATTLNGETFEDGLIFVNEDNGRGEIWVMEPDGSNPLVIGHSLPGKGDGSGAESTGVLDISTLVGYNPGSVVLSNNQGFYDSSLSVLINPNATPLE
jgi:hypothetical protein